jgi:succinyl-diaminopimelate desuccinylase
MTGSIDPVALTSRLIACRSVTPADDGVMAIVAEALAGLGFAVERFAAGGPPNGPVENLFATRGSGGPHFAFAGHVDVVPPGAGWTTDPFVATIAGDLLYGRGAVDM